MEFCEKCGSKVAKDDKFCQSCGEALQQVMQENISESGEQGQQTREIQKKKKRWPILVASLVFVFVLGGIGMAFFGSSVSGVKMDYLKAESNTMKQAYKEWSDVYGDAFVLADKMSKESYEQTLDLSASVSGDDIPNITLIQAILESMKLQMNSKQDVKKEQYEVSLNFMMNNGSLAELSMYQSNDKTAVKLPLLNEPMYYFIENEKFGEFAKKMDPSYEGTNNFKDIFDFKEQLETGIEAEYRELLKDYGTFLFTELDEENFNKEKNVQYQGKNVDKITLTLTDEEVKALITNLLNKIQDDEKLIKFFMKPGKVALVEQSKEEYEQKFINDWKKVIGEIIEGLKEENYGDGLVSTIYVNSDNFIIARDISIAIKQKNSDEAVKISYVVDSNEADGLEVERKLTIKAAEGSNENEVGFNWNTKKKKSDAEATDVNTVMKLMVTEYGFESVNLVLKMDTIRKTNEAVTDFTLETEGELLPGEEVTISGQLTQKIDQDLSKNYSNSEVKLNLTIGMDDYYSGYEEITVHLNADTKTDFTNDIEFPDLQSDGARNVSEMSEDEWYMIFEEISNNFEQLMYNTVGFDF